MNNATLVLAQKRVILVGRTHVLTSQHMLFHMVNEGFEEKKEP